MTSVNIDNNTIDTIVVNKNGNHKNPIEFIKIKSKVDRRDIKESEKEKECTPEYYHHPLSISISTPIIEPPLPPSILSPIEDSYIIPSTIKKILLPTINKRPTSVKIKSKNTLPTPKEKRVVTQHKKWTYTETDYSHKMQIELLCNLANPFKITHLPTSHQITKEKCMSQEISKKLYGYKSQDLSKQLFDESKFITYEKCIQLLIKSNLICFYCKHPVQVLYESVREPIQWSLERIDNTFGHNFDNVEIACLKCNISRRTMYHERYIFTKQLTSIIKSEY